jgi:hypothetical protein
MEKYKSKQWGKEYNLKQEGQGHFQEKDLKKGKCGQLLNHLGLIPFL